MESGTLACFRARTAETDHIDELELLSARFQAERGVLWPFSKQKRRDAMGVCTGERSHRP